MTPSEVCSAARAVVKRAARWARQEGDRSKARATGRGDLLSGLARCATCRGGMEVFTRWTDKARVYGCAAHGRKGPSICGDSTVIEMGTADAAVLAVVEQALDPELLSAVVDRTAEKARRASAPPRAARSSARGRGSADPLRNNRGLTGGGEVSHLVEALRALETKRQRLDRELKARSATFDRAKLRQALQRHVKDWWAMLRRRAEKARAILRKFVAERFVFKPNPASGYLFRGEGDRGLLQMASPTAPAHLVQVMLRPA